MFTYFILGDQGIPVNGILTYCQQNINIASLRPPRTVSGNLIYCQQTINVFSRP